MTKEEKELDDSDGTGIIDLDDDDLGIDDYSDYTASAPMDKRPDLLKDLTDFDPIIKDKINGWLGRVWNEEQKNYVIEPNLTPVMNMKSALWCIDFLKTYARKTNIITNIDRDEYKYLWTDIIDVIWMSWATRKDFGVTNSSDRLMICNQLEHFAILVLMGAGDGKYTKFLGTATNRNESVNLNPETNRPMTPQKTGFFNNIKSKLMGGK